MHRPFSLAVSSFHSLHGSTSYHWKLLIISQTPTAKLSKFVNRSVISSHMDHGYNYLSMLELMLIHVNKRVLWTHVGGIRRPIYPFKFQLVQAVACCLLSAISSIDLYFLTYLSWPLSYVAILNIKKASAKWPKTSSNHAEQLGLEIKKNHNRSRQQYWYISCLNVKPPIASNGGVQNQIGI